jgi:hypothetical protein
MTKTLSRRKTDNAQHTQELETYLTRRGPRDEPHDPTPQRAARAIATGQTIQANIIHTEAGFPTAIHYWRITPVVDTLAKRGTLNENEYDAALRYMRYYAGSRHKGPATAQYLPRYDCDMQSMGPAERAMEMGQRRAIAEKAVHPFFRKALRWLECAAEDERPLWHLGAMYYPEISQSQQSQKASVILHFTLAMLAEHFGIGHRFTQHEIEEAVETVRITIEIQKKLTKTKKSA